MLTKAENHPNRLTLVIAVVVFAVAAAIRIFFPESAGARIPYVTFFPAVIIAGLGGGFLAGFAATLLSLGLIAFFPPGAGAVVIHADRVGLTLFLAGALMVSVLAEMTRRAQQRSMHAEARMRLAAEREQAASALQESEARFRCYVENSPVAVLVVDQDGHYVDFNPAASLLLGYRADALSRMHILDAHPPEEHEPVLKAFHHLQRTGRMELETRVLRSDGRTIWVTLRAVMLDNGNAIAYCQDISALKGAIDSISETKLRLELAAKSGMLGVWEWDILEGKTEWNDRMYELYGIAPGDFDGTSESWNRALHAEDRARAWAAVEAALKGDQEYAGQEFRIERPDGSVRTLKADAVVLRDAEGGAVRMVGLNRDITEQRYLEDRLLQSQKMDAIGRLAGGIAHDFNNKLSVILGYAELAKLVKVGTAQFREYLSEIIKAAEHSRDVTRQLLAFSRKELIAPCRVDLDQLIRQAEKTLLQVIGTEVELELLSAGKLWPVHVDPAQVNHVLTNLAMNAREAMPQGGTFTVETRNVSVSRTAGIGEGDPTPGDYVMVTVSDTGIGMDPELQKRAFEPFFTTKGLAQRTGLGLATVYGIMSQNGGAVKVVSAPGKGATFTLFFPRLEEQTRETLPSQAAAPDGGRLVLLLEEEESVRRMVRLMLEKAGYGVVTAESPEQALESCRGGGIDCLVTDVVVPDMQGIELAAAVKKLQPRIGVVCMSGYAADVVADEGILEQGVLFIRKPFEGQTLTEMVRLALEGSPGAAKD